MAYFWRGGVSAVKYLQQALILQNLGLLSMSPGSFFFTSNSFHQQRKDASDNNNNVLSAGTK